MAAKLVIKKGISGKFHFNIDACTGQVIATSQTYASRDSARAGINSMRANASSVDVVDET
jgi:uncharacterized protein YegP (UPF0339 family)